VASNVNPTVRRRRLGQELRRLRELKGMTAEEVAERLEEAAFRQRRLVHPPEPDFLQPCSGAGQRLEDTPPHPQRPATRTVRWPKRKFPELLESEAEFDWTIVVARLPP